MKQKLLELLTAKYLGKGTRKDTLARLAAAYSLQCTTEEEAQALVNKLTDEQVTDFEKEYRSEVDSEISKATKTALEKAGKGEPKKDDEVEDKKTDPTDIATIIADAIAKANAPLLQEINSIKAGKTAETRLQQLESILSDVNPDLKAKTLKDFERISFKDETDFTEYLEETKTDIQNLNQTIVNQSLASYQPFQGNVAQNGVSNEVSAFISEKTGTDNGLKGKEI